MSTTAVTRRVRMRAWSVGALMVISGAAVPALVPVAASAAPSGSRPALDQDAALDQARESNERVRVPSLTTESSETWANPDGTVTAEMASGPVRVKRGTEWTPVDLTLVRGADGSVRPRAHPRDLVLAGAGGPQTRDLASVAAPGGLVAMQWSGALPEPVLAGDTATYRDIEPGIDLQVKATLTGFQELLVVKHKPTKPIKVTLPMRAVGVEMRVDAGGHVALLDTSGKVIGGIPTAEMWDARVDSRSGDRLKQVKAKQHTASRSGADSVGQNQDAVDITVEPADGFFDDPLVSYPVAIDPSPELGTGFDTWVQEGSTLGKSGSTELRMGYISGVRTRAYLHFDMSQIRGTVVTASTLRLWEFQSYSCSPRNWEVWSTPLVGPGTVWSNMPQPWNRYATTSETKGYSGCAGDWTNTDVRSLAQAWADQGFTTAGVMLRAENESDVYGWKKFTSAEGGVNTPKLVVTYYTPPPPNNAPNAPVDLGMESWGPNAADAIGCVVGPSRPVIGTRTPRVRARLADPDGGMLTAGFAFFDGPLDNYTWNGNVYQQGNVPSGSFAEIVAPTAVVNRDAVFTWHLYATDGIATSWSAACEFVVDTVAPNTPGVSSSDYPTAGSQGSIGQTGVFTVTPNGYTGPNNTMDVAYYRWSINTDTLEHRVDVSSPDGSVAVPVTPTAQGTNILYVQAFDRAGNPSAGRVQYTFQVGVAAGPVAIWEMSETSGSTASDGTGNGRALTLSGGASFANGYADNGLLTGNGGYASTSSPVVRTDRAFSVSAWVKLNDAGGRYTVAGQDGVRASGFALQYAADVGRWAMSAPQADSDAAPVARAMSAAAPQVGVWTHLVGSYEPNSKRISLYVNGKIDGTATATLWDAQAGGFVVGAGKWNGVRADYFPGTIDRVRLWGREISAAEAAAVANTWVGRARYRLDDGTGTAAVDTIAGYTGTLAGGVTWAGTPADPGDPNWTPTSEDQWARFDASGTGQITAARPNKLRTDQSYTVMAWARLTDATVPRAVVAVDGPSYSPFILGYRPDSGRWCLTTFDQPSATGRSACSNATAATNTWVHLAAMYDGAAGTISLSVNGVRQSTFSGTPDGSGVTGWHSTGNLLIGRGTWNGGYSDPWRGDIDDVRIYTGVLSAADVQTRYQESKHQ
ncbi:LamG-like jellyroll fold domain-containing protein [Actinokineospora sp.]|uniref:LamG-like jellyroll fold domain-containing protein n=1 Tax=Actinokineospora sp. TaxID=1872133 RepID=UPI0040380D4F